MRKKSRKALKSLSLVKEVCEETDPVSTTGKSKKLKRLERIFSIQYYQSSIGFPFQSLVNLSSSSRRLCHKTEKNPAFSYLSDFRSSYLSVKFLNIFRKAGKNFLPHFHQPLAYFGSSHWFHLLKYFSCLPVVHCCQHIDNCPVI